MDRRKFLASAGLGLVAAATPISIDAVARKTRRARAAAQTAGGSKKLKLSFFPYELKLRHAFNLARFSRTTTPDVQVKLEYDGYVGYGEASMPPYLGETVDSVTAFLNSLDLEQFTDPFRIEDILTYVDCRNNCIFEWITIRTEVGTRNRIEVQCVQCRTIIERRTADARH